jgi:hypothetical protein
LFYLQAVHEKSHFEVMAFEEIHDSPDADAIAVFPLGDCSEVLLEYRIGRRNGVRAVALQRLARGKVLRPNFPGNNKGYADLGFVRPFNHSWSTHVCSL